MVVAWYQAAAIQLLSPPWSARRNQRLGFDFLDAASLME
jgi:hypothetical protein